MTATARRMRIAPGSRTRSLVTRGPAAPERCVRLHPGPAAPRVLWAMKSKDHFIAAPVPHSDRLLVSGLGFINTANFYCLDAAEKPAQRVVWSKGSPFLELPTVSSPAILGDKVCKRCNTRQQRKQPRKPADRIVREGSEASLVVLVDQF